jgi:tRNA (guanine37-N1)-methyltransferase
MNLPDSAITFLDAFRGILSHRDRQEIEKIYTTMPMIHCHCFTREIEPELARADILQVSVTLLGLGLSLNLRQRVEEKIGHPVPDDFSLYLVRSVAPNKEMYCISFRLPARVAYE